MKRTKGFQLIKLGLNNFVKTTIPEKELFLIQLRKEWKNIVGKSIAIHTYPYNVRNGILTVNVDDSIWIQELTFQRDDIKAGIFSCFQKESFLMPFDSLRFKNGEVKKISELKTEDNENFSIDKKIINKIDKTIMCIEDYELRDALRRYFIKINLKT